MGNSEVGHLNLGAGAVVKQDLTRIGEAVRTARLRERRPAGRGAGRAARAPHRPRLRRRRALGLEPSRGAHRDGGRGSRRRRRPRVHRRARHAARLGRRLPRAGAALVRKCVPPTRQRARGLRRRTLLGDGSRQALGAHPEGVRHARARPCRAPRRQRRRGGSRCLRARRDRRVHRADDGRRGGVHPRRAIRSSRSTSAPTACARSRGRWRSETSTRSIAAAWRRSSGTPR